MLTKEEILKSNDSKTMELDIPEWGGKVKLATMSGFARDRFEAASIGRNGSVNMTNIRARLVAATIITDSGKLMFTDKDVEALGKKSAKALTRIYDAAEKLNAISTSDIEELAKN